ncbi:hypothetical protein [uncultured Mediterranean phage uvMED]|nr:hypothetical protein [uncultured Mediterranean phage uvMED]
MSLTKISNNSLSAISTLPASIPTGALTLISTTTISTGTASVEITSGIDSTYDSYIFKFINIHPSRNDDDFAFNFSTDGGSNYNVTKTTSLSRAYHFENDSAAVLQYQSNQDLAQSTAFQQLTDNLGNGDDECMSGTLQIFNPSSTTFVKNFISRTSGYYEGDGEFDYFIAGYGNTTSAINAIKFQMQDDNNNARGNIDDGIIKMYGVS